MCQLSKKLELNERCIWLKLTFPFLTASLANLTQALTLADIHRYLKNLWWADQNCPHMVFFILCSASISSAAFWNLDLAVTHCNYIRIRVKVMVFNATFNNISVISWRSVLLVEKLEYPEKTTNLSPRNFFCNYNTMTKFFTSFFHRQTISQMKQSIKF